jgi:hypothetical protein
MMQVFLGNNPLIHEKKQATGDFVKLGIEGFYRINHFDQMADFFMTIVSSSDHWMYISSNGALTAGRKNRDNALFPYYTVDKIHASRGKTGSKAICLVKRKDKTFLWEPFAASTGSTYRVERNLYKSIYGNKLVFEEINRDLGLRYSYGWYNSERFGWVRRTEIQNLGETKAEFRILDGIRNIMPYGLNHAFQNEFSNLSDAYKKNELLAGSGLGLFMLSSIPIDRAEPSEALKTTTVWSCGLKDDVQYLISDHQLDAFRQGLSIHTESDVRASKGSYYTVQDLVLEPEARSEWFVVAEINQDARMVADLDAFIRQDEDLVTPLLEDIQKGTDELVAIVAASDGQQYSREKISSVRHFSNVLYNVMRGGIFRDGYRVDPSDFALYVRQHNRDVFERFGGEIGSLDGSLDYSTLLRWSEKKGDPDLLRISMEYLPLTFSRRHGDPSRPWNQFSIELKNDDGTPKRHYQGNWRDIFQNWEALGLSFPLYLQGMISKFLNASTADGYNPYRITREGIDWESPSPDDPWAYIGYWGDHQIIYLQKFLEWFRAYFPGDLEKLFDKELFVFAHVPYRIKPFDQLLADPKNTIDFDHGLNDKLQEAAFSLGADGKLLTGPDGTVTRTNLIEKILVSLLAKLSNFIPEAGIWLNTQRPEWNDANNALVGNGVSMVTLYYIRRFLVFWEESLSAMGHHSVFISAEVGGFLQAVHRSFAGNRHVLAQGFTEEQRFNMLNQLGRAGSEYRERIYTYGFSGKRVEISYPELTDFIRLALGFVDQSIGRNKREDGLYHAYNLVRFDGNRVRIRYLYEMLEGQVAVLSSGYLSAADSLTVIDALKQSRMFRADQYSYLLYPDRELPRFTDKNNIPGDLVSDSILLARLVADGNTDIVARDRLGNYHFNGAFRNAAILEEALEALDPARYGQLIQTGKQKVIDIYETLFDHQSFTGRSGTFFGYEGLGSIYWHMVSKLLLAVQENYFRGVNEQTDPGVLGRIRQHYFEIKAGIGIYKSPEVYGAFPLDAYSHTPAGAGVKQPGLTGQVKEDVISRLGELGIRVREGAIDFEPVLLNPDEFLDQPGKFVFTGLEGQRYQIPLEKEELAFSFCQVPVVYAKGPGPVIEIEYHTGEKERFEGTRVPENLSRDIFYRTNRVRKIRMTYPAGS